MMNETQIKPYRDVRTLLFCKIAPPLPHDKRSSAEIHDALYQEVINAGQIGRNPSSNSDETQTFLTFGGYDAICVYPTDLGQRTEDWLHAVYEDKQRVIRMPSNNIIYHQMHLVSQHQDVQDIWNVCDEEYPFFMTTLAYGVNASNIKDEMELAKEHGYITATGPDQVECSKHEKMIRLLLRKRLLDQPADVKYAVYNGITVSDVVILWRAKDLLEAMDLITFLEYSGIARKTLTTLGFPVESAGDRVGQVKSCVINTLINNMHKTINISIHGAIRDICSFLRIQKLLSGEPVEGLSDSKEGNTIVRIEQAFQNLATQASTDQQARNTLLEILSINSIEPEILTNNASPISTDILPNTIQEQCDLAIRNLSCVIPKQRWAQSLGKNDFTVSACVSYANLAILLEVYRNHHKDFYTACWEILTDIRKEHPTIEQEWFASSKSPANILCKLYNDFQSLSNPNGNGMDLTQLPWFDALQELLGTHHYIDQHPVLHGPSYLVYGNLKIAYAYFAGKVTDYENPEKCMRLLKRSEENIIHFVRNLDQLTEQISRNDDAMLNQRSNTHTIHFSLPESALEFYHAFLRRIVDYLVTYDSKKGLEPDGFEYDFLLSPKPCSRFRFRPMLKTEHRDHGFKSNTIWPQKQAYILELPLESIFKPMDVFVPFVHECFHCFGDVLRQRKQRRQYMALFIATTLATAVGCGNWRYHELCGALAREIHKCTSEDTEQYLSTTLYELRTNTYNILEYSGLDTLFKETGNKAFYLYSEGILRSWDAIRQSFFIPRDLKGRKSRPMTAENMMIVDSVLQACGVYFKECYADAMAIALLNLKPDEYLERTLNEIRRYHVLRDDNDSNIKSDERINQELATLAQRFAIVLAACCDANIFNIAQCENSINAYGKLPGTSKFSSEFDNEFETFAQILLQCFKPLVYFNMRMPEGTSYHPPAALRHVVNYLVDSIALMRNNPPMLDVPGDPENKYTIEKLTEDFDNIIRKGNMFGERFYTLIYEHHYKIQDETSPYNAKTTVE